MMSLGTLYMVGFVLLAMIACGVYYSYYSRRMRKAAEAILIPAGGRWIQASFIGAIGLGTGLKLSPQLQTVEVLYAPGTMIVFCKVSFLGFEFWIGETQYFWNGRKFAIVKGFKQVSLESIQQDQNVVKVKASGSTELLAGEADLLTEREEIATHLRMTVDSELVSET
jgi:hypothetical protein